MARPLRLLIGVALFAAAAAGLGAQQPADPPEEGHEAFRFRSGVDLVNVVATVSDSRGRFVPGLSREDFSVYEEGVPQEVTHFSAERVPVSLGIVLDTSGSMAGDKIDEARRALDRFVYDLLDEGDEVFLYRFSDRPTLVQGWTTDRTVLSRSLGRITPNGGTAMYDAVMEAIPLAATGRNPKKAVLVISDGNDTSSTSGLRAVRQAIRGSEVLVYAIGIDGDSAATYRQPPPFPTGPRGPRTPRMPFPPGIPGIGRPGGGRFPAMPQIFGRSFPIDERVNSVALRDMTDDNGGRTEIVRSARDLVPATTSIADELSKQYSLAYASTLPKDGRWHTIRVEVHEPAHRVRARRGYFAG
ncbi:MAG: VWA domain-containing protein [Vicinamibacterales bacterium]